MEQTIHEAHLDTFVSPTGDWQNTRHIEIDQAHKRDPN